MCNFAFNISPVIHCHLPAPQLARVPPTSSPVPVAVASLSLGPVTWMMIAGIALMNQPHVVSEEIDSGVLHL